MRQDSNEWAKRRSNRVIESDEHESNGTKFSADRRKREKGQKKNYERCVLCDCRRLHDYRG
jgi:hypothetical protein